MFIGDLNVIQPGRISSLALLVSRLGVFPHRHDRLLVQWRVLEEERDRFAVVCTTAGFCELYRLSAFHSCGLTRVNVILTVGLMSMVSILGHSSFLSSCGTVLVTTSFVN